MKRIALGLAVLAICFIDGGRCRADESPRVVYLDQARSWRVGTGQLPFVHLLARELMRQAFLLAARDELGLVTRDAWLGDFVPVDGDNAPFDIVTTPGNPLILEVLRVAGPDQAKLLRHEFRRSGSINYGLWTKEAETLSRTKFVEALKQAGFQGQPNARSEKVAPPESVEELLGRMDLLSQFHAVRELHELIRSQGESSALLGSLVRGYANLGVLTEYYWHPAHKVFKARALLYAQRMCVQDEHSPVAKWHRAYAAALTGLHAWALADLAAADEAAQEIAEKDRPAQPAWAQLIGPFCRYEVDALDKQTNDDEVGQLASLLKYLAVEQAGSQIWAVQTATDTLPLIPECYRVYDGLCEFGGVSAGHAATTTPVRLVAGKLYGRLEAMPGLPDEIERIVKDRASADGEQDDPFDNKTSDSADEFKARRQLIAALLKTSEPSAVDATVPPVSDRGEPSWAALGLLIRELSFMQVYRRAHFLHSQLDVSCEEWFVTAAPLVEGHPCKVLLDTFAVEADKAKDALTRLAQLDCVGKDYPLREFYNALRAHPDKKASDAMRDKLFWNRDDIARDFFAYSRWYTDSNADPGKQTLDMLLKISPYSPFARGQLIQHHWNDVQEKAEQWDKESASHPGLSAALATQYTSLGRWDDAERCLQAAILVVPSDLSLYQQLATLYQQQGQTDRWLATLEGYLNQRDFGLEHYSVQSQIAHHYMYQKQWEKALPYAEGAAESYSAWGLSCAAECNEGLQRWGEAERLQRACSERYQGDSLNWYFFCRRTGKGEVKEARVFARNYVDKLADMAAKPNGWDILLFYLLEEQPEKALVEIEKLVAQRPVADEVLWLALIADQLKDAKNRDAALNRAKLLSGRNRNDPEPAPNGTATLVNAFVKDLAQDGKGQIDLEAVDKVGVSLSGTDRFVLHFALAQYLTLHGRQEDAGRYALRCMGWPRIGVRYRTLAGAMLVQQGVKPAAYKALLQPSADEPDK
jgi:hypothetical protein